MSETTIEDILAEIQTKLHAPKALQGQGVKYKYRSNELILQAVKPHLQGAIVVQNDDVVMVGTRYYMKATTTISKDVLVGKCFEIRFIELLSLLI